MIHKLRDVSAIFITEDLGVLVACDSSGGLGMKVADDVKVSPKLVSQFCLRVALMEILALGGKPKLVVDTLSNEMDSTGKEMLAGIETELKKADLENQVAINGSTEENMPTTMTALGITVVAEIQREKLAYGNIQPGDYLYQVGLPYVGEAVIQNQEKIFSYQDMADLKAQVGVVELLPVGSKGILYEADQLARASDCSFQAAEQLEAGEVSAGPATVLLVATRQETSLSVGNPQVPIQRIGRFF